MGNNIIGIDFGTSSSLVSTIENGVPQVLKNIDGHTEAPTCIYLGANNTCEISANAEKHTILEPNNTIKQFKRIISTEKTFTVNNLTLSPTELSALFLNKLVNNSLQAKQEKQTDIIISVPTCYNLIQRAKILEAAEIAGFKNVELLNDTTAVALSYAHKNKSPKTVLIVDFGGGKLDVSIVKIDHNTLKIIASSGDEHLGGIDIDHVIANYLISLYQKETGVKRIHEKIYLRFMQAAEAAKINLSVAQTTEGVINYLPTKNNTFKDFHYTLTREKLEELISPLLHRAIIPIKEAFTESRLKCNDIDDIVLSGGSCRIPLFINLLTIITGKKPKYINNLEEQVALGTAIMAGIKSGQLEKITIEKALPWNFVLSTKQEEPIPLFKRNNPLPQRKVIPLNKLKHLETFSINQLETGSKDESAHSKMIPLFNKEKVHLSESFEIYVDKNYDIKIRTKNLKTNNTLQVSILKMHMRPEKELKDIKEKLKQLLANDSQTIQQEKVLQIIENILSTLESTSSSNVSSQDTTFISSQTKLLKELISHKDYTSLQKELRELKTFVCKTKGLSLLCDLLQNTHHNNAA